MKRIIFSLTIFLIILIVGLHRLGVVFFCYEGEDKGEYCALVLDKYKSNEKSDSYKVKINGLKCYYIIYVSKNMNNKEVNYFEVGDYISFYGEYNKPEIQRNSGGFDYDLYLKSKGILGSFKVSRIKKLNRCNWLNKGIYKVKSYIENIYDKGLKKENSNLIKGIVLGEKNEIDDDIKDMFRDANLSHVLVISVAHFSYIILIIDFIFKKYKKKRYKEDIKLVLIILFVNLVGFSPSIIRASFMVIYAIISKKVYRQTDFLTAISLSLLIQIIENPYVIFDNGLMLSYGATMGIVLFSKGVKKYLKFEVLSTTIAANIMIAPIMAYFFNTISISFFISNILVSFILGPVIIGGIILIFVPIKPCYFIFDLLLSLMRKIVEICSKIPYSKVYICKPDIAAIVVIYLLIFLIYKSSKYIDNTKNKVKEKRKIKKVISAFLAMIIILNFNYEMIFSSMKNQLIINFVDVGQGDCTLLRIKDKTILIDAGGSTDSKYDVGEKIVLPYLLNKKINKIDYLIYSHFDADHAQGSIALIDNIKVKNIVVSKNIKESELYNAVMKKAKEKNINVIRVKRGDSFNISDLYFYIIHPEEELITFNEMNNNSIVCKAKFGSISVLFTGDIEKEAEEKIIINEQNISNANYSAKSDILKVAHHGSNSSSIQEFLNIVKPRIALIGVGKDNKFGHPNDEVINRLESLKTKIYRTDNMGEITIKISNGKYKIDKYIK